MTLDDHIEQSRQEIRAAMRRAVEISDADEVWVLVRRNLGYKILRGDIPVVLKSPVIDDIAAQQAKAA